MSTIYNPTNNVVLIKYVNKISNHIYNSPINVCLQNLFYTFSLLTACMHCSAIFDFRCYNNIQPTVCLPERNGGSHPAAQLCVHIICIIINNCVYIKYLHKISNHILNPHINVCFPERNGASHCAAHFCVYIICIITNNCVCIKYRTQNLRPYFKLTYQCVFPRT